MSAAHTPGPWVVLGENVGCATGHIAFTTCNPRTIDETRLDGESWLDMRGRTKADRDELENEVKANARLIAAAPELLEKLEAWQAVCDRITDQYGGVVAGVDFGALGRANRALVAKATGQEGGANHG